MSDGGGSRYESLDACRGAACLAVVVLHSTFYLAEGAGPGSDGGPAGRALALAASGGWWGVPVFFVVSGYCVTASCQSAGRRGGRALDFFARRFVRIFPPYWAALAVTSLALAALAGCGLSGLFAGADHAVPVPWSLSRGQWAGNVTLTESWRNAPLVGPLRAYRGRPAWALGQAWTLAYEEQFYAVCGLALAVAPRRFFAAVAAVTAVPAAYLALALGGRCELKAGVFFSPPWFVFASGVLAYYVLNVDRRPRASLAAALALGGVAGVSLLLPPAQWHLARSMQVGAASALLLVALRPWDGAIAASPLVRPLSAVGVMSYSLYLAHWPLVKVVSRALFLWGVRGVWPTFLVTVPVCLASSLAAGWAFHHAVERHFLPARRS